MLSDLKKLGTVITVPQDELFFSEGEYGECLYILLSGSVDVYKSSPLDNEKCVLATLRPGDIFGEMAMIRDENRNASVIANEDTTALKISKDKFQAFVSLEPRYAIGLMKTLSDRVLRMKNRIIAQEKGEEHA